MVINKVGSPKIIIVRIIIEFFGFTVLRKTPIYFILISSRLWFLKYAPQGPVFEYSCCWTCTFGFNDQSFHELLSIPGESLWLSVDPLAEKFPGVNPYVYCLGNPVNLIDPDGRAPDWIYDQQKDGSYKRREGTANDGGANNHTYINRDGTTHYYNQKENTVVSAKHADIQKKIENFSKAVEKRREIVKKTGEVVNNIGDGIAAVGYVAAPFTEGASLSIAAIGEGVALGGKVITNAVNFEESGMTKDNFTNLGVDVALEIAPKPLENALKKANLDQIVRNTDPTPITNMVQTSIGKVKLTIDYVVKKQLEENK